MDPINFDTVLPVEIPVTLAGVAYVLKEPSGKVIKDYRKLMTKYSRIEGKKVVITDTDKAADGTATLVSICLFEKEGDRPVTVETIHSWPNKIVEKLASVCLDLAGLSDKKTTEEDEEEAKNS